MGASRKKVVTSEGSNVSFTKYNGHSENINRGLRFQRCGARWATSAKRYEIPAKPPSHVRGAKNNCSSSRSFLHAFAIHERGSTASVTLKTPTSARVATHMTHSL